MSGELIEALRAAAAFDATPLPEDPLPISVAPESDETVTDPGRFAQHVVRVISTWAAEVEMLSSEQRDELLRSVAEGRVMPARSKQTRAGLSVQLPWLAKGEFARDIKRELAPAVEVERSAVEYLDSLKRLMRLIRTIGRSLRKTLQIAHTALSEAARAEADQVGLALIESSIAAWEPQET